MRGSRARAGSSHESMLQAGLQFLVAGGSSHANHGLDVREWS